MELRSYGVKELSQMPCCYKPIERLVGWLANMFVAIDYISCWLNSLTPLFLYYF